MVQTPPEKSPSETSPSGKVSPARGSVDIGQLIVCDPQIQSGRPTITGTGMTVRQVVDLYEGGQQVGEIVAKRGYLTLAKVYAALAYYHANEKAVDVKLVDEVAEYEKVLAAQPEWWRSLYCQSNQQQTDQRQSKTFLAMSDAEKQVALQHYKLPDHPITPELEARWQEAWQLIPKLSTFLKETFGASRVRVFGSAIKLSYFSMTSDIDLAAWDIPSFKTFSAMAAVDEFDPAFRVDLAIAQSCRPNFLTSIEAEGIDV